MYLCDWLSKTVDIPFDEELCYEELMKCIATSLKNSYGCRSCRWW